MEPVSLIQPCSKLMCGCRIGQVAAWRAHCLGALRPKGPVREMGPEGRPEHRRVMGGRSDKAVLN